MSEDRDADDGRSLRRRAERMLLAEGALESEGLSSEEARTLLHDLRVHQIELEMQNEELRRAQQELEVSREQYVDLYDLAPVGYVALGEKGLILKANLLAADLLGLSRSALVPKLLSNFIDPGDQDTYYLARRRLTKMSVPQECELRMVRHDGTQFWARLDMRITSGGPIHVTLCDITSSKQAEQERRDLEAKVLEGQRLESLGVLAGGVAHDFNNLLAGIIGNACLVLNDLSPNSPNRPLMDSILMASDQAAALTSQMLAYSGRGHFVREPVDLNVLFAKTSSLLESAISKSVRLEHDLSPDLPVFEGDVAQVRQILINLVTNASDACGEDGGVVTIRTRTEVCKEGRPPGGLCVVLECSDTGCGMEEETRARIFEPFFTTKSMGRGLGLAAMEGIVRGLQGAIMVESTVGVGTRFTLMFPVLQQPVEAPEVLTTSPSDSRVSERDRSGVHVLVLEDSPEVLSLVTRILRRAGYEVSTACNGKDGLDIAQRLAGRLDLVLLDVVLPDIAGPEVFQLLKRDQPELKIMFTTGYSPSALPDGMAEASVGVLKKPYHPSTLIRRICAALDEDL